MLTKTFVTLLTSSLTFQSGETFWDHFLRTAADVGGNLRLILLDVDGDGRREIFLAPSVTCGNAGCGWYVYSPTPVANQVRYLGEAGFSPGGYRLTPGTQTLTVCWRVSVVECRLAEYRFLDGEMTHHSLGTCRSEEAECQAELNRIVQWQRDEGPSWLSADVPESGWRGRLEWSWGRGSRARPAMVPDLGAFVMASTPN